VTAYTTKKFAYLDQVISEEKIKLRNAKDGQTMDNTQLNQMTFANEIKKCFLIGTFTF
jgi:hypothetical protein